MKLRIKRKIGEPIMKRYFKFRSSIYGQVVFAISLLSVFLFLSYAIIFRTVYGDYLESVIQQNGNNVGSIVESALYHSMLENNKDELQNTLNVINTMSGIDEVNLYNEYNELVYTSFSGNGDRNSYADCLSCHTDIDELFPAKEKAYEIFDGKTNCDMAYNDTRFRYLMIRTPILNQPTCYTADCHAHSENDEVLGSLIITSPLDDLDNAVAKSTTEFFFFTLLATVFLGAFLILFTKRKIHKPLSNMIKASIAVSSGDRGVRLFTGSKELYDIQMMSKAFNEMLDKLNAASTELENWSQQLEYKVRKKSEELSDAQNELIHIERIASLGKLSASVAHELNNPLSGILVYTKLVYKQLENSDIDNRKREAVLKHLKFIENETKRCGDIVKGLLDFSKKDQQDFEVKHLHDVLNETCKILNHSLKIANVSFISDYQATNDMVYCNQGQIKQAIIAIIVNAIEAVSDNGEIILRTENSDNETLMVEVIDNGTGISEENLPHVFEPFFSTKHQTSGIGLGLAIVHGIIQNHNAKIGVKSTLGEGTTIQIAFSLKKD